MGEIRYLLFQAQNKAIFEQNIYKKNTYTMIITEDPENKPWKTKLILNFKGTNNYAVAMVPHFPTYQYGDLLLIEGVLIKPKNFTNKYNQEFNYRKYLNKNNIFYEIMPIKIDKIGWQGNIIKKQLIKLKQYFTTTIKHFIPPPESFLLNGFLFGEKNDLGKEILTQMQKTGVIHIVVLSGYNLSLVADFFSKIFIFFGVILSNILAIISIILFIIMTGASSTSVRAGLMASIIILSRFWGKETEALFLLLIAGFLMLFFNPMILLWDASFQLSFMATLGLILLTPFYENKFKFITEKLEIREIISATLATTTLVFPLLLSMVGEISWIAPALNILILITIPITMLLGLLIILFSWFWGINIFISFIAFLILKYNFWIIDWFAKINTSVSLPIEKWTLIPLYLFLIPISIILWKKYRKI